MAGNINWKDNTELQNDLKCYVSQNLRRCEVLDFVQHDYLQYSTLDRHLRKFDIHYINYDTPLAAVAEAVQKELDGPGRLLGYRAMNQKLRTEHKIQVPRHVVHNMMADLDLASLEARNLQKKRKKPKGHFTSEGPLWVVSLDGHDKLCGYQNWTFPLGIYGCIDTFSRKILFLFVCTSNSDPFVVGKMYLRYLFETKALPRFMRIDRGTETGKMATIHTYLINKFGIMNDPTDSVIYGPSTSNKIEWWWRDLHERLEKLFKQQLTALLQGREYNPHFAHDHQLLAYVYVPIVQRECTSFVNYWNSHRIRAQGKLEIPTGIPNHMFSFPDNYEAMNKGIALSEDDIQDVAEVSGVMGEEHIVNFIEPNTRQKCVELIPHPENIDAKNAIEAYRFLKQNIPDPPGT